MKKRKKLFISIFSIFAFVLSFFSISNVYAYSYNNENEILNNNSITDFNNYSGLDFDDEESHYSSITLVNKNTYYIQPDNMSSDSYIFYDSRISTFEESQNYIIELRFSHRVDIDYGDSVYNTYSLMMDYDNYFEENISSVSRWDGLFFELNFDTAVYMQVNLIEENSYQYDYYSNSGSAYYSDNVYNDLLDEYNQLNSGFNELGFLYYLDYWNSTYTDDLFSISDYVDGSRLNLYELVSYNNPNYAHNMLSFYFNESSNKLLVGNLNFIFSGGAQCEVRIVNQDGDTFIFQASDNLVVNQDFIISNDLNDYLWESINEIHFVCNSPDDVNGLNFNVEYTIGFNDGYNSGYTYGYTSGYNSGLSSNNSYYHQLYDELVVQYNDLQELYNDYINGNVSFNTLVWNIATIPFESFKQIWNVDLLGLNIGNFVTALMFVGVVVYIWKKFL